jgi:hypothetical protein
LVETVAAYRVVDVFQTDRSPDAKGQSTAFDCRLVNHAQHPKVQEGLAKHPRIAMHFTPTSASWLNMVELFFRDISERRLRCGVFTSVLALFSAIDEYVVPYNIDPKPFIWTKVLATSCKRLFALTAT